MNEKIDGNCFPTALHISTGHPQNQAEKKAVDIIEDRPATLVHGWVIRPTDGFKHQHAWVEISEIVDLAGGEYEMFTCLDFANGNEMTIPRDLYYRLGNIEARDCKRYQSPQIEIEAVKSGTYGPWDDIASELQNIRNSGLSDRRRTQIRG